MAPWATPGLTGRKIIVDTYGGMARHGGGAFSGKDPSKVDRSAAYATRWVAKNVVACWCRRARCEVQVAYAIGVARPMNDAGGNVRDRDGRSRSHRIESPVQPGLRPASRQPSCATSTCVARCSSQTAAYGHFGRESADGFTWERTDRVDDLKSALGL